MTPLRADRLRGVWGTLLLPLEPDDSIDRTRLADQLDRLLPSGVDGIYAHGTAGEFHTLSEAEYDAVNALLAERAEAAGVAFQLGASHPSAQTGLDRLRRAREHAPGAIQVILPDWVPLSDAEVTAYVVRVVEAADPVPVVLYNPPHAKTQVRPELLGRLLDEAPGLIGVKVAGGDEHWYAEMVAVTADRCALFVAGHLLASGLARGAHGSYSNVAALSPAGAARWYRQMLTDPAAALDVERRIAELFAEHVAPLQAAGFANPALDKFLAAVGGWAPVGTRVRWPYASVRPEAVTAARRTAESLVPELFPTL